ncbi:MAG: plastocyanin/azurin family copper-binding protein [Nitrospinaceae bacterium]
MNKLNSKWMQRVGLVVILVICSVWAMGMLPQPSKVVVVERDTSYNPDVIMVKLGQVLEVRNRDEFWHSSLISKVDENGFETEKVFKKRRDRRGGEWDFTFKEPGNYVMRCTNHDGMSADIQVVE